MGRQEVRTVLREVVNAAHEAGMSDDGAIELWKILSEFDDVFRLRLGRDPAVDVPPLRVRLKPDTVPVRGKSRRYPEPTVHSCANMWVR